MDEPIPTQSSQTVTRLGSYRLVEPLGAGGMSSVFRAVHIDSGYEVALKVLPRYLAKNQTLLQRFLREAQSAEALEHPNIVSIFDRGSESGRHYLVLEYVGGSDLHERVRNHGPLSIDEALSVLRQAAEGLRYASSKGVIHRDIKPANLLRAEDGSVKLIDLGLALQNETEDERVTRHGTTVGTVDYMSPEQARDSRAANEQSDMYSLGCTLYYLLTGFPPFPGGHIADKLRRHALQPAPDVRQLRPDVPRSVAKFIQRLMAKRPEERFSNYDEFIAEIEALDPSGDAGSGSFEFALIADDDESADFLLGDGVNLTEVPSTRDHPPIGSDGQFRTVERPTNPSAEETQDLQSEFKLAELLEDEDTLPATKARSFPTEGRTPMPRTRAPAPRPQSEAFDPFDDLDEEEVHVPPVPHSRRGAYGQDASLKAWVIGGALVGLVIALLGFALISLIRMDWSGDETPEETPRVSSPPSASPLSSLDPRTEIRDHTLQGISQSTRLRA